MNELRPDFLNAPLTRRAWLGAAVATAAAALLSRSAPALAAAPIAITVYKDPSCGCCVKWVDHLRANGFAPTVHDTADMARVKASLGVPAGLESCHTAVVGRYTIEGHVPAAAIKRLLAQKPALVGLAVPGMPAGAPGMEMGGRVDPYDVIAFTRDGKTKRWE